MVNQTENERVTFIPIYVTPYYSGPKAEGAAPEEVAVGKEFDALLKSVNKADILKVRDLLRKNNSLVTPMTLFVLSARLYDVGEKEEAVFWFYAARDRYRVTEYVGDPSVLSASLDACNSFNQLLGPFINGFAFCKIDKQIQVLKAAAQWSKENPYKALLLPQIPSRHKDREKAISEISQKRIDEALESEKYMNDPVNRKAIIDGRKKNGTDKKYCF